MNREIEFRAKNKDGEWVYGFYVSGVYDCGSTVHYIVHDLTHIMSSNLGVDATEIDVGTLGQYTGLKDKNDKKIYSGDLVGYKDSGAYEVEYKRSAHWLNSRILGNIYKEVLIVVGNIHDSKCDSGIE